MSTTSTNPTYKSEANKSNPNNIADILRQVKLGNYLSQIKVAMTGATPAAAFDITTAAFKALCTITGITLDASENLPALRNLKALRVTANTGGTFVGTYVLTDAAGDMLTAATHTVVGIAQISDDGKTITFPTNDVSAFILEYSPVSTVDMGATYP